MKFVLFGLLAPLTFVQAGESKTSIITTKITTKVESFRLPLNANRMDLTYNVKGFAVSGTSSVHIKRTSEKLVTSSQSNIKIRFLPDLEMFSEAVWLAGESMPTQLHTGNAKSHKETMWDFKDRKFLRFTQLDNGRQVKAGTFAGPRLNEFTMDMVTASIYISQLVDCSKAPLNLNVILSFNGPSAISARCESNEVADIAGLGKSRKLIKIRSSFVGGDSNNDFFIWLDQATGLIAKIQMKALKLQINAELASVQHD